MPRALPAPLATAIASGSAKLSTILEIKRRDGAFVRLTDAASDITSGGRLFHSEGGYERTAMSQRDGFEVDDMEITGNYNSTWGITEDDVRNRLYAGAPFTMWWLDRSDPTNARAILMRGNVGRVKPQRSGSFKAELRGIKNVMRTVVTQSYTYECVAQLGDSRCRVPLAPPEVQRGAAYVLGDFVRVATHASAGARADVPILNPSFEAQTAGVPDNWTTLSGTLESVTADGNLAPAEGLRFLEGAASTAEFSTDQTVAITGLGVSNATIDAGDAKLSFSCRRGTGAAEQRDLGRVLVEALDGSGGVTGTLYDSGYEWIPLEAAWDLRGVTAAEIPASTRSIRIELSAKRRTGTRCQAAFDDVRAAIWDDSSALGQEQWEDRIYECTGAGTTAAAAPAYSTGIGTTTVDGTATFTSRESWMKRALVASVTDRRTFTLTVTESRAVDGWFDHGVVHWETGANAGLGMEIKDWIQAGSEITLFLAMGRDIAVGDRVRLFPGCGRYLSQCRDKFDNVINYRGFPKIPGNDFVTTYPGAR